MIKAFPKVALKIINKLFDDVILSRGWKSYWTYPQQRFEKK